MALNQCHHANSVKVSSSSEVSGGVFFFFFERSLQNIKSGVFLF